MPCRRPAGGRGRTRRACAAAGPRTRDRSGTTPPAPHRTRRRRAPATSSRSEPYPERGILIQSPQGSAGPGFYLAPLSIQPPIRVLILDDHKLVAETLGPTPQADARLEVV